MDEKYQFTVNHSKCVGSQICVFLNPDIFKLNENGQSIIIANNVKDTNITEIAEQCPQSAIIIEKYNKINR